MSCTHGDKGQAVGFCVAEYAAVAGTWPHSLRSIFYLYYTTLLQTVYLYVVFLCPCARYNMTMRSRKAPKSVPPTG